jgi:multidrug efflux pump subunit AcrA (membrane-fusion protein)
VPKKAVTDVAGQPVAWVVAGGVASQRRVTLGADRLDLVEVTSGLMPGETVILNAPAGLTDRAPVRVKGS